jgi:hypothetical protein
MKLCVIALLYHVKLSIVNAKCCTLSNILRLVVRFLRLCRLRGLKGFDLSVCICSGQPQSEVTGNLITKLYSRVSCTSDRLCGLVVRVPGYRSRGPGFESRRYQISWEVVVLERGPLSLVRITEELLERNVAAQKTEINGRGDSLRWPRDTLYPLKLALTSPTIGGRSVGIVRWRTKSPGVFYPLQERRIYREV